MDWMTLPLKRYAEFSGRSRRREYWMFVLFIIAVSVGIGIVEAILGLSATIGDAYGPISLLFLLAIFIPSLAVQVRRFHDQGRSGWFVLLNFIPFIGTLIVLVFMCLDGTDGPNEYGPDPKASLPG
ncbi:DUF805 domain-containing protein [Altererythrobacter sp. MTPC7]|uniref:DUF805 domain-containing protein n=1 Tax=Altererythrobacter sp. MTPC7 TaxID=3056567 RepID=UPI0036F2E97F